MFYVHEDITVLSRFWNEMLASLRQYWNAYASWTIHWPRRREGPRGKIATCCLLYGQ